MKIRNDKELNQLFDDKSFERMITLFERNTGFAKDPISLVSDGIEVSLAVR